MTDPKAKRIIFLGTPEFAVASLRALVEAGFNVVAVVTMPDKPAGRGLKLQSSAVKQYAESRGIPVLQPEKLKNPSFLEELRTFKADVQVVVAFRMLPEQVWNMPPYGTFNLHASLLPNYRGAAPINWAIVNGEHETGITTFKLRHEIDTGDIVHREAVTINETISAGELHDLLMEKGAKLVVKTVEEVLSETAVFLPQMNTEGELKPAPKIFREHCRINWSSSGEQIHNLIRGMSPYPAAFSLLNGQNLKIFKGSYVIRRHFEPAGSLVIENNLLRIATADGYYFAEDIQLEGKKRMPSSEFVKGLRLDGQLTLV
jgi:methionyl-tRNA formyltransferase